VHRGDSSGLCGTCNQPANTALAAAIGPTALCAATRAYAASHVRGQPGLPPPQRRRLRRRRSRFGLRHLRLRDGLLGLRPAPASRRAARGQRTAPTAVTAAVGFAAASTAAVTAPAITAPAVTASALSTVAVVTAALVTDSISGTDRRAFFRIDGRAHRDLYLSPTVLGASAATAASLCSILCSKLQDLER